MSAIFQPKRVFARGRPSLFRHAPANNIKMKTSMIRTDLSTSPVKHMPTRSNENDAELTTKEGQVISSSKRHNSEMTFTSGISTLQNTRQNAPEDRVIELLDVNDSGISLFGVVDGHGGADCASFVSQTLPQVIQMEAASRIGKSDTLLSENWGAVLEDSFRKVADQWDAQGIPTSGAVATLILVSDRNCLIAHAGDCKVIASLPEDSYVELTRDHRCNDPDEVQRIEEAGGVVFNGRVEGRLLPSRAFGDINVRTMANGDLLDCISPEPDICYHYVEKDQDGFVIVASDGLFDAVPCAKAVAHVRRALEENGDPEFAAKKLVALAAKRTTDDVSVIVLSFRKVSL